MLGAQVGVAVRADQAFMTENLGNFLQRPSVPCQGGGRVMAQVMPAELFDIGIL
jgi:hypothetical protein